MDTLPRARKQFDDDHYGLEKVKKRLLEYLAVLKLKQTVNEDVNSEIVKAEEEKASEKVEILKRKRMVCALFPRNMLLPNARHSLTWKLYNFIQASTDSKFRLISHRSSSWSVLQVLGRQALHSLLQKL